MNAPLQYPNLPPQPAPVVDLEAARRYLRTLDPGTREFTFQTFDDVKTRKEPTLAKTLHGTIDDLAPTLARLNRSGAGIYVTVNATANGRRGKEDIISARTMFREADSPDLPPMPFEPHLVVETSPGKRHEYFLHEPTSDFETWEGMLETVVRDYGGDPGAKGRNRVLRVPGFFHMKDPAHPHLVRIIHENGAERLTLDELARVIPPTRLNGAPPADRTSKQPKAYSGKLRTYTKAALEGEVEKVRTAPEGLRNDTLNRAAFSIGQLVAGGEIDATIATTALHDAATAAGLPGAEASRTIQSGLDGGSKEPRQVPTKENPPTHYSAGDLASNPPEMAQGQHYIAVGHAFLDIEAGGQRAIEYVLDGAIQAGLVVLAASTGVGKTTSLVPLLARGAWLVPGCPLTPKIMRRIIYITEDSHQVMLILRAMIEAGVIADYETLKDRFLVLDATRMPPHQWAEIIETYSQYKAANIFNGVTIEAAPLVVLDTKSAVLDLEEENSNTENSRAIATIRQRTTCPVLIVTHVAKAQRGQDASLLSARGADSQVADAQQLLTMSIDPLSPGARWLEITSQKHRFRAKYDGISFELRTAECAVKDAFGQTVLETVAYGHPVPVLTGDREQARKDSEELSQDVKAMALRSDILKAVGMLAADGSITSKRAIHGVTGGRKADVIGAIDELVNSGELVAVMGADAGISTAKKGQVVYLKKGDLPVPGSSENDGSE